MKQVFDFIKAMFRDFRRDDCPRLAASLSYYSVFALPPLLILLMLILGAVVDRSSVQQELDRQTRELLGPAGGEQVRSILRHTEPPGGRGPLLAVLGALVLAYGATKVFGELQTSLNRVWEVKPDPRQGGWRRLLLKRLFSFGMVLGIAFLLLVSLALSAILTSLGNGLGNLLPGALSAPLLEALNFLFSFGVTALLFAAMFKVLPDVRIAWRDVAAGAVATAFLFVVGKSLIGLYLGRKNPGDAYGAAGSLVLVLVWIYYSAMILLLGAEFTQTWAQRYGRGITPKPGAVRMAE